MQKSDTRAEEDEHQQATELEHPIMCRVSQVPGKRKVPKPQRWIGMAACQIDPRDYNCCCNELEVEQEAQMSSQEGETS